jgi:hypothetical protein
MDVSVESHGIHAIELDGRRLPPEMAQVTLIDDGRHHELRIVLARIQRTPGVQENARPARPAA